MNTRIYEMTEIMAELNSEYIYESIVIESETDNSETEKEKRKTIGEKLKKIWKTFCEFVKKAVDNVKKFIRSAAKRIFDSTMMEVPDVEAGMVKLRELVKEIESDKGQEKLDVSDLELLSSDLFKQSTDAMQSISKSKKKKMRRYELVKLYEKCIYEIEGMVKRIDAVVARIVKELDNSDLPLPVVQQKAYNVGVARGYLYEFLNSLIKELQKEVNKNTSNNSAKDEK